MKDLPVRKTNRLKNYDYSQPSAYFITFCTADKKCLLSEIIENETDGEKEYSVKMTEYGLIVDSGIKSVSEIYENVIVDNYVIMPNHVHILLRIVSGGGRMVSAPTVIGNLKRYATTKIGSSIWQKGYYDHVIRDETDFQYRYEYINDNPRRWKKDKYYL